MFYDVTVEGMQRGTCMLFYLLVTLFSNAKQAFEQRENLCSWEGTGRRNAN